MLITNQPGQRGLTKEGENAFKLAFDSTGIFESEYKPLVRLPREAAEIKAASITSSSKSAARAVFATDVMTDSVLAAYREARAAMVNKSRALLSTS